MSMDIWHSQYAAPVSDLTWFFFCLLGYSVFLATDMLSTSASIWIQRKKNYDISAQREILYGLCTSCSFYCSMSEVSAKWDYLMTFRTKYHWTAFRSRSQWRELLQLRTRKFTTELNLPWAYLFRWPSFWYDKIQITRSYVVFFRLISLSS